jgi:hypothetical protein
MYILEEGSALILLRYTYLSQYCEIAVAAVITSSLRPHTFSGIGIAGGKI